MVTQALLAGCLSEETSSFTAGPDEPTVTNSPPTIAGSPMTQVDMGISYSFVPVANDTDGDSLTFSISNRPSWSQFDSVTGELSGQPALADVRTFDGIQISVSDGSESVSLSPFSITVSDGNSGNSAPNISGIPATSATIGSNYNFQPTASDPNGDTLTLSIQNLPSWATFDSNAGLLSGTPQAGDEGSYNGIIISVSDGTDSASLPAFSITVTDANAGNNAPTISGTPATSVSVGSNYNFLPTASDPDGDAITLSIQNQPPWATFDSDTGLLEGTPQAGDEGTYANIIITVSDGTDTADLAAFSIDVTQVSTGSATLSWEAPTQFVDGSGLSGELAGYRIYYGTAPDTYTTTIQIDGTGLTTYVVENLAPDTYYFATTAFSNNGLESDHSNEATKTIN